MIRTIFRISGLLVLILALLGGIKQEKNIESNVNKIQVSFLGVKEDADCILLQQGQHNVLIDTGEKKDASEIVAYLKKNNVSTIQYLILSHYDIDHIGGAADILDNFTVKNVIRPYYEKDNEKFKELTNKIKSKNIPTIIPTRIHNYSVGDMNLLIYPPLEKEYSDDNNYSLATLANYKKVNMLFTGDAVKKRTDELMQIDWPKIDLYKVPYHGRANSDSEAFIKMLKPDYAVVTSKDADSIIKDICEKKKIKLFYTVPQTVKFSSDGSKLNLEK